MSPLRKINIVSINVNTPRPPKGGVADNKRVVKVPFRGFRG